MTKIGSWLFVAVLVLSGGSSALAQTSCPTTAADKITISGVDFSDNASYEVYFGNTAALGLSAVVYRNGACVGLKSVRKGGADLGSSLPTGTNNVCLGTGVDVVTILSFTLNTTCGSATLSPWNYAGNRMSVYGNSGNDRLFGGSGADTFNGSFGIDSLSSGAGTFDQIFGGDNNDTMTGGSGTFTWSVGGANDDIIQDTAGFQDSIEGGSGNDLINAGCNPAIITCGSGATDVSWHPSHFGSEPSGCETNNHSAGC